MAVCGRVCIVTTKHQTIAGEAAVLKTEGLKVIGRQNMYPIDLCSSHDRIVSARFARDGRAKPVKGVVALVLNTNNTGHAHSWGREEIST